MFPKACRLRQTFCIRDRVTLVAPVLMTPARLPLSPLFAEILENVST